MNPDLIINMFYAAPEFWYALGAIALFLIIMIVILGIKNLKLKQKNYFINRDRNRYSETLHSSKDGYFAFLYPDNKVNDPRKETRERCSRRLCLILNLEKGQESSFDDILNCFYKNSAKKIAQYALLLKNEGISFEEDFTTKNDNRHITLNGCRIENENNVFCDMIWFRDITTEKSKISNLEDEKKDFFRRVILFEEMINNIPYPVWMRDKNLNITIANKKYQTLINKKKSSSSPIEPFEINDALGENISKNLALLAISSNKIKKNKTNIILDGQIKTFEVTENPFYSELDLNNICSVGVLSDISETEQLKLSLKLDMDSQLEFFGSLGNTAFAVFDKNYKLSFCNNFFKEFWRLNENWIKTNQGYGSFLDFIREERLLPEVPNFIQYKKEEYKYFEDIIEPIEDMLHLPDGRTIRRVRAKYPTGGMMFAYEDVSDNLATRRAYNELKNIQNEVLNDISDSILIFNQKNKLIFYNDTYIKTWKAEEKELINEPSLFEIVDYISKFFSKDYEKISQNIISNITKNSHRKINLERDDKKKFELYIKILSDGSTLLNLKEIY